jgi:peroxiredoxin
MAAVVGLALLALIGLFGLMSLLPAPSRPDVPVALTDAPTIAPLTAAPPAVGVTSTARSSATAAEASASPSEPLAAQVDDVAITVAEWRVATLVDSLMSRLTGQALPTAEETLQRLINETLVLRAAGLDAVALPLDEAEAHIQRMQTQYGISDQQLMTGLTSSGLLRQDLMRRTARLILVERGMAVVATQHPDLDAWLAQARSGSSIVVYSESPPEQTEVGGPATTPPTATATETTAPTPTPAAVGAVPQAMAPDFELLGVDGAVHQLSQWRGQPVLLNFWATWCPPCRAELPALQAASERYAGRITIIGIAVGETAEQVAPFVAQYGLTYPLLLDLDNNVTEARYAIRGLPTTLFVAADGIVSARHIGPLTEADIDRYLAPLVTPAPTPTGAPDAGLPTAPDFTLDDADGRPVTLSAYRDRSAVVLVFYRGQT